MFLGREERRSQEWPGGKEGVRRKVRRRPSGMGVTEAVKEGGDTQICILGNPCVQVESRLEGSEAAGRETHWEIIRVEEVRSREA